MLFPSVSKPSENDATLACCLPGHGHTMYSISCEFRWWVVSELQPAVYVDILELKSSKFLVSEGNPHIDCPGLISVNSKLVLLPIHLCCVPSATLLVWGLLLKQDLLAFLTIQSSKYKPPCLHWAVWISRFMMGRDLTQASEAVSLWDYLRCSEQSAVIASFRQGCCSCHCIQEVLKWNGLLLVGVL